MIWRCRDQRYNTRKIIQAVENGELEEEILDRTVERILKVVFSYADNRKAETVFNREKDHKAAADIETECAVLLEIKGALPLRKEQKIVYIGNLQRNRATRVGDRVTSIRTA